MKGCGALGEWRGNEHCGNGSEKVLESLPTHRENRSSLAWSIGIASGEQMMWNSTGRETCIKTVLSASNPSLAEDSPYMTIARETGSRGCWADWAAHGEWVWGFAWVLRAVSWSDSCGRRRVPEWKRKAMLRRRLITKVRGSILRDERPIRKERGWWEVTTVDTPIKSSIDNGYRASDRAPLGRSIATVIISSSTPPCMPDDLEINPYELLDLSTDATEQDIRTAYRKISLKVHPDRVRVARSCRP